MFIPLHDANHLKHIRLQYVTISLIVLNVLVWIYTSISSQEVAQATAIGLGYIPALVFDHAELPAELVIVPDNLTYITYAFLHGDFFHLAGNMLFLWVFGDNVEDALGHVKFLIFYLASAVVGAWLHGIMDPNSEIPLIGASGAVAGVVTAYLLLHPRVQVWVLVLMRLPLRIPAWIPIVLWIAFQFLMFAAGGEEQVSWAAHVGGIVAGGIMVLFMRRRAVPLFDRVIVTPKGAEVVTTEAPIPSPASVPASGPPRQQMPWGRQP
ncbi:MAG: rhomboid family intramembrane serine protease [Mesorhizobium sp.]|nr:rhomboid family intramembrane serine protease [Mesorhizobium sp.]